MTAPGADAFTTRPTLRGNFGMVASTHWLATAAGQSTLERGGNAIDAAVAAGFVLHLVEPHLNGPGGDMNAIVSLPTESAPHVVVGQGPAPAAATIDHYLSEGLSEVPGAGALAAAVPGSVMAWFRLLEDHGTLELADVLSYAVHYARTGHAIGATAARTIDRMAGHFSEHWAGSAALWMPEGRAPRAGDIITYPAWADVLERLIAAGAAESTREGRIQAARHEWSHGFVAEAIERFVATPHRHSSGTDHRGVLALADLADFDASYEDATVFRFRGVDIAKTGPWAQGPVLLQALAILDGFSDDRIDPDTAEGIHTIAEALKLALADRDAWYGDPEDASDVPLDELLSAEYAAARRALIEPVASHELRAGSLPGRTAWTAPSSATPPAGGRSAATGEPTVGSARADDAITPDEDASGYTRGDTCHVDVVDRWGSLVSATPSGGWLQSSPTIPELGFCLGTRLQMTWLDPASPSALTPGRRPRSTLSPTILVRDGVTVEALGTPGGDQQDQWQLLYLLRTIVFGYTPQQAIDAPAFHTTSHVSSFWPRIWEPGGLVVEDRVGEGTIAELRSRGHVVSRAGDWSLGRLSSVRRDPATGELSAAANPRGLQGYAAGR
ncbi:gamma-glutamyltranspeptidase/glutathione hydrolase [Labedella gwakjiensis]|uniref:Gamma-glutamyltranspeptidase/glutathione hydrolase n=1 Tax=Labedella gwakjiensis TaxID=390269 RepID=A0A2P8GRM9_9MICO|nr:gamma-glutamyltransferase [Labedella gwakjiensis]PSL36626.1 gamma-glutamyltranspeptidase/glutathione hydrolase [Labedella gwakjiensis]RUQ84150.1 transferase [Labedella gwakjiensis]